MSVWLLRHGESLLNAAGRLQGWSDAPLTERGRMQARERGASLAAAGVRFDAAFSADGIRHRETARDVLGAMGERMPVTADPRWRELDFGDWDGKAASAVDVEALHRFIASTPALLIGVSLADAVGERRAQNVPGTHREYPNWQVPLSGPDASPLLLEELASNPRFKALTGVVERALGGSALS